MVIDSIYLKGYKPLVLNNVNSIQIAFKSVLTLILGTNGCGKSFLLKELTPLPATPVMFMDKGEKHIHISYGGNSYVLSSYVGKSAKHTFVKNGEVLHSLATTRVHTQRVIEEFNYTNNIHKLLIGDMMFTQMSPQERKDILTLINPLSLNYALAFHDDLKEQIRDTKVILKHITIKNASAKTKLKELDLPDNLTEVKSDIESEISDMLPFSVIDVKREGGMPLSEMLYQADQYRKQFAKKYDNRRVPVENINSIEDLRDYIDSLDKDLAVTQSEINTLANELYSLNEVSAELANSEMSKVELETKVKHFTFELKHDYQIAALHFNDHLRLISGLEHIETSLNEMYGWIPDEYISVEDRPTIRTRHTNVISNNSHLLKKLDGLTEKLGHYNDPDLMVGCPKCDFVFSKSGEDVEVIKSRLKRQIQETEFKLKEFPELIETYSVLVERISIIENAEQLLLKLKRSTHECFNFWTMFNDDSDILFKRDITIGKLHGYILDVKYSYEKSCIETELEQCNKVLKLYDLHGNKASIRICALTNTLEVKRKHLSKIQNQLHECKSLHKYIGYFQNISKSYDELQVAIKANVLDTIDRSIKNKSSRRLSSLYGKLGELNESANMLNHLTSAIEELDVEQHQLSEKLKSLLTAEELISPNKGFIASQMKGFITNYISRINKVSNQVWTYQLELSPCSLNNGVLNYVFPLSVKGTIVPDIVETSKSQEEMVNLSFTMVMRDFLNLGQYPLYFDETGAKFDDTHRHNLINYMKSLIASGKCSQMFFINHYDSVFSAFRNTNTVVLDAANVTVSQPYNQNVTFNEEYNPQY
jgi:prefoldin subunit 5